MTPLVSGNATVNQDVSTTAGPTFATLTVGFVSIAADGSITSSAGNNTVSGSTQFTLASRTPQIKLNVIRQTAGDAALSVAMVDVYATNLVSSEMLVRLGAYGENGYG